MSEAKQMSNQEWRLIGASPLILQYPRGDGLMLQSGSSAPPDTDLGEGALELTAPAERSINVSGTNWYGRVGNPNATGDPDLEVVKVQELS